VETEREDSTNAKKDRYRKCQGKKQHYSLRESEKPTERRKPKEKICSRNAKESISRNAEKKLRKWQFYENESGN
jgi:hypothetical protein